MTCAFAGDAKNRKGHQVLHPYPEQWKNGAALLREWSSLKPLPKAALFPRLLIKKRMDLSVHGYLPAVQRKGFQLQFLTVDLQCAKDGVQHHGSFVKTDYLRDTGHAQVPTLVQCQFVGQLEILFTHVYHLMAVYAKLLPDRTFDTALNKGYTDIYEGGGGMQLRYMALKGMSGHDAGRQLLEQLYRERTGKPLPEILIAPRGKPYFADGSLHFSISHTKQYAFCVLSDRPVGIDAEEKDRKVNLRLADKILSPGEKACFDAADDKHAVLLKLWVLKEAAGKLTGDGINGYPDHTDFSPDDPRIQEIDGCYVAIVEE